MRTTYLRGKWSRREFLSTAGLAGGVLATGGLGKTSRAWAGKPISISHSVSTAVYLQHLVALEKKWFEAEGVPIKDLIVPGGGAKVVQALAAGQAMFALGDSNHPLKITAKGKPALMILGTDIRCSYANIVVRKDLYEKGVRHPEDLANRSLVGRKAIVAATRIGSGTYVYGNYVLGRILAADGKPVNDHVEWVGGGGSTTMLGGLKAGKFDAIMAVPVWMWRAQDEGFGEPLYDVLDAAAWKKVFGGNIPVTVGYVLKETVDKHPEATQGYVNACYRAQRFIQKSSDQELADLIHKRFMSTFKREHVLREIKYYRTIFDWDLLIDRADYANGMEVWHPIAIKQPIPYEQAVDMSFVRKAHEKYRS